MTIVSLDDPAGGRLADSYSVVATEEGAAAGENPQLGRIWPSTLKAAAFVLGVSAAVSVVAVAGWAGVSRQRWLTPSFRKPGQEKDEIFMASQGTSATGAAAAAATGSGYYGTRNAQVLNGAATPPLGYYNEPVPANPAAAAAAGSTLGGAGGYAAATTITDAAAPATGYGAAASAPYGAGAATGAQVVSGSQTGTYSQQFATTTYAATYANNAVYSPTAPAAYPSISAAPASVATPNYAGYTNAQMEAMYTTMTFTTTVRHDSLFCFALMMPSGYEKGLIQQLHERSESIFACDDYTIFSETDLEISPGPLTRIVAEPMGSMKCEYGGPFDLALNTDVFTKAWRKVFEDGKFLGYGWTIKVDPDCVFLPSRLRQEVRKYNGHEVSYLNNCDQGLHGPLEVISLGGMKAFRDGINTCTSDPKLTEEKSSGGEDVFLRHCMTLLNIAKVDNFGLLSEQACFWEDPVKNGCTSGKVSFHPFKKPELYFKCLDQAKQSESTTSSKPTSTSVLPR